ncbi:hypothetical protein RIF29_24733 [Crotalaria pallida]|uniref:Uncharacterized protein n=1 Tax=Crotalaria pallida TaxID=3830 RepID=A0AAN9HZ65_CROPI
MDVVLYIMTSEDQSESEDEGWAAALGEYARLLKSNIEGPDDEDIFASLRNSNESEQVDGEKNAFEQEHAVNFEAVNEEFDTNEWNEPPLVRAEQAFELNDIVMPLSSMLLVSFVLDVADLSPI